MAFRLLAMAWAVVIVYGFPGYLTADSTSALAQARGATLIDWHPPMMSVLWRVGELVATGPVVMLLLQTGCFLFGLYGIARTRLAPTPAAIVAAAVLLFPPVLAPMTVIWKDSQMAGFLLAGTALALSGRPRRVAVGALFLFLALSMRHNAMFAVLPIVLAVARTAPALRRRWWRWSGAGVLATLGLTIAAGATNRALTEERTYPWHRSLAVLDLAGTIREAGPMPDDDVRDLLDGLTIVPAADLQAAARAAPNRQVWWVVTHGAARLFEPPDDARSRAAVERAWRRAVTEHPAAWLRHRMRMWAVTMGFGRGTLIQRVVDDHDGLPHRPSKVQTTIHRMLWWCAGTPLFMPFLYVLLAVGLVIRSRGRGVVAMLAASGLCHSAGLFVAAPSPDFRYSHWTIACAVAALALTVLRRAPATDARPDRPAQDGFYDIVRGDE